MDLPFWSTSCQSTFVRLRFNIPGQYITNMPARHSGQKQESPDKFSCSLLPVCWSVLVLCLKLDGTTTFVTEPPLFFDCLSDISRALAKTFSAQSFPTLELLYATEPARTG